MGNNLRIFNILVLFIYICSSNKYSYLDDRIVNGIPTNASQFPFIASLSIAFSDGLLLPRCGGSIFRKEYPAVIITAAHCLTDSNGNMYNIIVDLYRNDVYPEHIDDSGHYTEWKPIYKINHQLFNATTYDNDIGLIFLDANLTIYPQYSSVIIANDTTYNNLCCDENEQLTIIGYGYNKHNGGVTDTLQYSKILFMNTTQCNIELTKWYIDTYNISNNEFNETDYWIFATENQICAIGNDTDACQGDSGGPLMKINTNQQVGIISTGFGCNENIPAIYTNIGIYYEWIHQQINQYINQQNINITSTSTTSTNIMESTQMLQINGTDSDINDANLDENLQLAIGCSVAGFLLCVCAMIYVIRTMRNKQFEKYNRMKEENKEKIKKKFKSKNKRNEMEGALNVNTISEIEMNDTKLISNHVR